MSLKFLQKRQRRQPLWFWVLSFVFLSLLWGGSVWFWPRPLPEKEEEILKIRLWDTASQQLLVLGLEAYVWGVVAAEMPASFPLEALKAQAVAARTYALRRLEVPDPRVEACHAKAQLSSDPAINQAWQSKETMKKRWGKWHYGTYSAKLQKAVEATRGEILLYEGQLIDPVYHASCGGQQTEDAAAVWQFAIPYLKSVPCTGHRENHDATSLFFSWSACQKMCGLALPVSQPAADYFQIVETSATGRVQKIKGGSLIFSGAEIRTLFNLPSTRFTCQTSKAGLTFLCNGYGHGVGLCQYGAAAMADDGKDYQEILQHYYQGVESGYLQRENV